MTEPRTAPHQEREIALKALIEYVVHNGAIHAEDCPGDDTCDCVFQPTNAGVNLACRLLAALPPGDAPQTWQLIETAPKDGTNVLVAWVDRVGEWRQSVARWDRVFAQTDWDDIKEEPIYTGAWTDYGVGSWGMEEYRELQPTHWKPLDRPPVVLVPAEEPTK